MRKLLVWFAAAACMSAVLSAIASPLTAVPVSLLPPQLISIDASTWAVTTGDFNNDGFDDIATLSLYPDTLALGATKPNAQVTLNIYRNIGKTKSPTDAIDFAPVTSIPITPVARPLRAGQQMGSLQLVDIDGDGKLDVLISVPASGALVILWNQGTNAPAPFEFVSENMQPDKTLTLYPALASSTGASPLYAAALDVDGDGTKDIVVYDAGVTSPIKKDPTGIPDIILSSGYESFGVLLQASHARLTKVFSSAPGQDATCSWAEAIVEFCRMA